MTRMSAATYQLINKRNWKTCIITSEKQESHAHVSQDHLLHILCPANCILLYNLNLSIKSRTEEQSSAA